MNQEEYEKLLFNSRAYNTSNRCYEIEGGFTDFLINFIQTICEEYHKCDRVNVFKSADVLDKRYASPYYEKGEYVGYRWFSEPINVSTNMCLYVELHKESIKKVL